VTERFPNTKYVLLKSSYLSIFSQDSQYMLSVVFLSLPSGSREKTGKQK